MTMKTAEEMPKRGWRLSKENIERQLDEAARAGMERVRARRKLVEKKGGIVQGDLTVLDWYAGHALTGLSAGWKDWSREEIAEAAYELAEAMVRARARNNENEQD